MNKDKHDTRPIDHNFTNIAKIHGDPARHIRLHLPCAPFGRIGVHDQHPRRKHRIHIHHFLTTSLGDPKCAQTSRP